MNRNLRLKIEESIVTRQISENLCFLCLACLNDKITYSKQTLVELERQRNIIAAVILKNRIAKETLLEKMRTVSRKDYPTFRTIVVIAQIIENNDYSFVQGFIPDRMIHYKDNDELLEDKKRIIPEKQAVVSESEEFMELCNWIEECLDITVTDTVKKKLKSLEKPNRSNVIFQCCLWNKKVIIEAIRKKAPFDSEYAKFMYFCGIVKNYIPKTEEILERRRKDDEQFWLDNAQAILRGDESLESMIYLQCEKYPETEFCGKNEYVREKLQRTIEKLKIENENF